MAVSAGSAACAAATTPDSASAQTSVVAMRFVVRVVVTASSPCPIGCRARRLATAGATGKPGYLPLMEASICFWTFSRLNEPGVWLGG